MITEKDIEAIFEKWFKTYPKVEFPSLCKDSFTAAIELLLPIIEKQGEALEELRFAIWHHTHVSKHCEEALAEVEEMIKKIGGV